MAGKGKEKGIAHHQFGTDDGKSAFLIKVQGMHRYAKACIRIHQHPSAMLPMQYKYKYKYKYKCKYKYKYKCKYKIYGANAFF